MSKTSSSPPSGKGAAALVSCAVGLLGIGVGFAGAKLLQILRKKRGIANSITETIGACALGGKLHTAMRPGVHRHQRHATLQAPCISVCRGLAIKCTVDTLGMSLSSCDGAQVTHRSCT